MGKREGDNVEALALRGGSSFAHFRFYGSEE
jgi:hypothetical protein